MKQLPALFAVFAYVSLLTVGGGLAAFPELRWLTVDVHHWLTFPQLVHLFSIGQLAPGPNMMMVAGIGQWVAGPLGAIVVVTAFFLPSACLTFAVGRIWDRIAAWPWRDSIQRGLAPVAIGLLLAGAISLARGAINGWLGGLVAAAVLVLLVATRLNPALLIVASAIVGLAAHAAGT